MYVRISLLTLIKDYKNLKVGYSSGQNTANRLHLTPWKTVGQHIANKMQIMLCVASISVRRTRTLIVLCKTS